MAERRRPNYMSVEGQSSVASILYEIHLEAIRELAGTDEATPEGFADKIRDLSTRYTDQGGLIDQTKLGPRIREKVREVIVDSVRLNGPENFTSNRGGVE